MRVLAWCVMSTHWHLVLWPREDGDLSEFMRWLTVTHTQRWHAAHRTAGTGPLYQGRFKSFPIQEDDHLLTVLRYVERNPLRANLVEEADAPYGRPERQDRHRQGHQQGPYDRSARFHGLTLQVLTRFPDGGPSAGRPREGPPTATLR